MMLKYIEPRMSIIELDTDSIIVTSSGLTDGGIDEGKSESIEGDDLGWH